MSEEGRPQQEASRGIMGSYPEVRTRADRPISAGSASFSSRLGGSPLCREAGALLCCLLSKSAVGSTERQGNTYMSWPSGVQPAELQGSEAQISPAPLGL